MRTAERLGLAHLSYQRAIAAARVDSTPMSWRRLLTARSNLDEARRARELEQDRVPPDPARSAIGGRSFAPPDPRCRSCGLPGVPTQLTPWGQLLAEWDRAQKLMSWSRALVAEARALCASSPS